MSISTTCNIYYIHRCVICTIWSIKTFIPDYAGWDLYRDRLLCNTLTHQARSQNLIIGWVWVGAYKVLVLFPYVGIGMQVGTFSQRFQSNEKKVKKKFQRKNSYV